MVDDGDEGMDFLFFGIPDVVAVCETTRNTKIIIAISRRRMAASELQPLITPPSPPPAGGMMNEFFAGGIAGCISIVAGQPFDTLKVPTANLFFRA